MFVRASFDEMMTERTYHKIPEKVKRFALNS